jgi:indole-3-glycerol phosphate synthase
VPHPSGDTAPVLLPLSELKRRVLTRPAPPNGLGVLRSEHVTVIAEVDLARPDRGRLAEQYEHCGAGVIAVPADATASCLSEVSLHAQAPLLWMEPVTTAYRLWHARAHGAGMVRIPAAAVPDVALVSLVERAASIGLAAVVEVRCSRHLLRALRADASVVLLRPPEEATAEDARAALHELLPMVPARLVRIAECGPAGRADLVACARLGVDAVLLGSTLLSGDDPAATVAGLASIAAHPALSRRREQPA